MFANKFKIPIWWSKTKCFIPDGTDCCILLLHSDWAWMSESKIPIPGRWPPWWYWHNLQHTYFHSESPKVAVAGFQAKSDQVVLLVAALWQGCEGLVMKSTLLPPGVLHWQATYCLHEALSDDLNLHTSFTLAPAPLAVLYWMNVLFKFSIFQLIWLWF
jgi:hypothetical protein